MEAWAPEEAPCLAEALVAVAEGVGTAPDDAPSYLTVPVAAGPGTPAELLATLADEVLGLRQVLSLVPVRVHLMATEDGGVAGDLEVVHVAGDPAMAPTAVAHDSLAVQSGPAGWSCRLRLLR